MMMNKSFNLKEFGRTGLNRYGGQVAEEFLPELTGTRWQRIVREMTANDATIGALLFAIEMMMRQVEWTIEPVSAEAADAELADFVRGALFEDMSQTWPDTVAEIISFLPWGWSYLEIVYKERRGPGDDPTRRSRFTDGKIGWRKLPLRAQESFYEWLFDDEGGVQGLVQSPAPDFVLRTVPIEKALLFRTNAHKNNPEGLSILRRAYRSWYFKKHIENMEGIGLERDLAGLPKGEMPSEYMSDNASDEQKEIYTMFKAIVTSVRRDEQEGIIIPSDRDAAGNKKFDFSLVTTGGRRQFDTNAIIQRYDVKMLNAVLADFIMLGHEGVGSYALSADKTEMFLSALGAWLDSLEAVMNRYAIPRLLRLNGMREDVSPQLRHAKIKRETLEKFGAFLVQYSQSAEAFDDEQKKFILGKADIPAAQPAKNKK
jgi:hypothetical protein